MSSFAIGVDLGGTNLRIAAVESSGKLLEKRAAAADSRRGPDHLLDEICAGARELGAKFSSTHHLLGLGVGVPGVIDMENGIVCSATNLPEWSDYPVRAELESRLQLPVVLENDANCAALGEQWLGAGKDVDDLCMITLGTGVGGGFLVQGKPWRGQMGMAGELGHMTVEPEGIPCGCGSRGCLEQYASARAIERMAREAGARGELPGVASAVEGKGDNPTGARLVFELFQQGNHAAKTIFETVGTALGIALANLINALNLPLHIVGGGVAGAWPAFSPALFRELKQRSIVFRAGEPRPGRRGATAIVPAQLRESAGVLGAARLPMLARDPAYPCSMAG